MTETRANTQLPRFIQALPVFSPVASRLLSMACDERASFKEFSQLIESEPALAADILRLANSPLYAHRPPITGILRALAFLGLEAVRGLALTVALRNFSLSAAGAPCFRECWRHNLACALLAGDLAADSLMEWDRGYTLGLLHDSGRLALLTANPVAYNRLLQVGAPDARQMLTMENELFGVDHCQLAECLADQWRLPPGLGSAMAHHHDPYGSDARAPVLIVQMACRLADMAGFPAWGDAPPWNLDDLQEHLPRSSAERLNPETLIPWLVERINGLEGALMH